MIAAAAAPAAPSHASSRTLSQAGDSGREASDLARQNQEVQQHAEIRPVQGEQRAEPARAVIDTTGSCGLSWSTSTAR